jgi:hypothetical protein
MFAVGFSAQTEFGKRTKVPAGLVREQQSRCRSAELKPVKELML